MKKYIFIAFVFFISFTAHAQYFEVGVLVGGSNYFGDLTENSSRFLVKETHLAGGVFVGYQFGDFFATKLGFNYAKISGADVNAKEETIQFRNLDFQSTIFELNLRGEWNIMGFQPYNYSRRFSPFLFAGVAGFKFKPKTEYLGSKIDNLQSIGTEGQGMPGFGEKYKLLQVSIPFGIGVKYLLAENWTLGLEFGARFTFTDYLDDVGGEYVNFDELLAGNGELAAVLSYREAELEHVGTISQVTGNQRGDTNNHDWYFIAGITISYNFIDNGMLGKRRRSKRRSTGCPTD